MNQSALERLLSLLTAEEVPDAIRKNILLWLHKDASAKAAFMIVDGKTYKYGRIRITSYKDLLERLNGSPKLKKNRSISIFELQVSGNVFGVLGLKGSKSGLENALKLISLFEQQQRFKKLLESSQNTLRNLSNQSALIAQNNARLFEKLNANMRRLQTMSKGVIRMQEAERAKISRELHDGIGQALTALKMNLDFVTTHVGEKLSSTSRQHLEDAREMAEHSLSDVRELSRLLRPRMLDDLGLLPTLQWAARTFSKRTGIKVKMDFGEANFTIDPELETMLFRIIQEALNNIAKYSKAKTARVQFRQSKNRIRLIIRDDGIGFDISDRARIRSDDFGSGLSGMRDRVALWGGKFGLESQPGQGTTLCVELPGNYTHDRHSYVLEGIK